SRIILGWPIAEYTCLLWERSAILLSPKTSFPAITDPEDTSTVIISRSYSSAICCTKLRSTGLTILLFLLVITFVPTLMTIRCLHMFKFSYFFSANPDSYREGIPLFFFSQFDGTVKSRIGSVLDQFLNVVVFHGVQGRAGSTSFGGYPFHPFVGGEVGLVKEFHCTLKSMAYQ